MKFMNEDEIAFAQYRHVNHPVLSRATTILYELMRLTNQVSDGWPYWNPPCRAARKLQELIQGPPQEATEAALKKAVVPIKALLTRKAKEFGGRTILFD